MLWLNGGMKRQPTNCAPLSSRGSMVSFSRARHAAPWAKIPRPSLRTKVDPKGSPRSRGRGGGARDKRWRVLRARSPARVHRLLGVQRARAAFCKRLHPSRNSRITEARQGAGAPPPRGSLPRSGLCTTPQCFPKPFKTGDHGARAPRLLGAQCGKAVFANRYILSRNSRNSRAVTGQKEPIFGRKACKNGAKVAKVGRGDAFGESRRDHANHSRNPPLTLALTQRVAQFFPKLRHESVRESRETCIA